MPARSFLEGSQPNSPVANLCIRRHQPGIYHISFAPPQEHASGWLPLYEVKIPLASLDEMAGAVHATGLRLVERAAGATVESLLSLGQLMARRFLPQPVLEALIRLPPHAPLLISTDDLYYPWELMHLGQDFLAMRNPTGRQYLGPATGYVPTQLADREREDRISSVNNTQHAGLLLIANPSGDLDASDTEMQRILEVIDAQPHFVRCTAISRDQAGRTAILAELATGSYRIIHYSGHITAGEDGKASLRLVDGLLSLDDMAAAMTGQPLVFLNGCGSAKSNPGASANLAVGLVQAGAKAAIGTIWPISDAASAELSAAFYQALFHGQSIGEALRHGRQVARNFSPGDPLWASLVLFGDPIWQPISLPDIVDYFATVLSLEFHAAGPAPQAAVDAGPESALPAAFSLVAWGELLAGMAREMQRYGGLVWHIGSGDILATFGIPHAEEDQAQRAAWAALRLRRMAESAGLAWSMGVATGTVTVYRPSAPQTPGEPATHGLLLGRVVEQAQHISHQAQTGEILVTPDTHRFIEADFEWRQIIDNHSGSQDANGPVGEVQCMGLVGELQESAASHPLATAFFIGREMEFQTLWGYWQRCCERRQRHIIGVVGEGGI
ncbi:MAG: CHAT domain-containing protein, partial [Chloroflexi bacterium]|nr:CHAT domain-containing protein [Chloroflexota bacterium]